MFNTPPWSNAACNRVNFSASIHKSKLKELFLHNCQHDNANPKFILELEIFARMYRKVYFNLCVCCQRTQLWINLKGYKVWCCWRYFCYSNSPIFVSPDSTYYRIWRNQERYWEVDTNCKKEQRGNKCSVVLKSEICSLQEFCQPL